MNDYYDAMLLGERNAFSQISKGKLAQLYIWGPWLIAFGLFIVLLQFTTATVSLVLLWISLLMSIGYSAPPLRIKERKFIGLIFPPIGIFLLFLQGALLVGELNILSWMIVAMVFLLTWYAEGLHLLSDTFERDEVKRLSRGNAVKLLKGVCITGIAFGVVFALYECIFALGILFWSIRYYNIGHLPLAVIVKKRREIFSNIWRVEEFILYTLAIFF